MPDRYWCTACDVGYTSMADGSCPHCGTALQDMEGFEGVEDDAESEYADKDIDEDLQTDKGHHGFEDEMAEKAA